MGLQGTLFHVGIVRRFTFRTGVLRLDAYLMSTGGYEMKKGPFGLVAILLLAATVALAGAAMAFKCDKCGLKGEYGMGGGFRFEEITCYCTNNNHFVSVTWKRGEAAPKPVRKDGDVAIYECRECKKATARQWDQKSCPKCGNKKISVEGTGTLYD